MTPHRHRSGSNVSAGNIHNGHPQRNQSPTVSTQQPKRQMGLTPAIYENNMKVLLRREPSIISIFDQFSHVCVYHHNGSKWEKQGFEGSMFLFERQAYPPYGFFILNRMGTDDYICPIHPEDDMDIMGDYLMYRYYPKFTELRIAMGLPYPIPPQHRPTLDGELLRRMTPEEIAVSHKTPGKEWRGTSVTIGLWMFATDAREPLKDVMMRLHSYIKQGKPYPEEFRYGPGRPPPPNPHLRTASRASISHDDEADMQTPQVGSYQPTSRSVSRAQPSISVTNGPGPNTTVSELDKLFAKLMPSAPSTPAPSSESHLATNGSTSTISVQDLFASMGVTRPTQQQVPSVPPAPDVPSNRGLALLDSIFASASAPAQPSYPPATSGFSSVYGPPFASSSSLSSNPEEIEIVSPKPTSSTLPQILNQDVISSLLGLSPDSRASSAAPSSAGSRRSGQNRYEGDNEYSEGELASESDYSVSSTVLDIDVDPAVLAAGSSSGMPLLAAQHSSVNSRSGQSSQNSKGVEGDVTPRAVALGIGPFSPPLQPQRSIPHTGSQQYLTPTSSSSRPATVADNHVNGHSSGRSSTAPSGANQVDGVTRPRNLVPFEADSDLWPYPRAPLDDRSLEQDDADVVELDFADTRALSDPAMFTSRLKEKQSKTGGKKKTRKERAADRERERREIEEGWDDPVRGQVQIAEPVSQPASSSSVRGPNVNGNRSEGTSSVKSTAPQTNGHVTNGSHGIQAGATRDAIIGTLTSLPKRPSGELSRNDFVRELLTLIHTDKDFVDRLWQDYVGRAG